MAPNPPQTLEVFAGVVKVVLLDGQLTQEEKRLLISIARGLDLDDGEPKMVYESVMKKEPVIGGQSISSRQSKALYRSAIEVAFSNFDLSTDEKMLFTYLEDVFDFNVQHREKECTTVRKELELQLREELSGASLRRAKKRVGKICRKILNFGTNGGPEKKIEESASKVSP